MRLNLLLIDINGCLVQKYSMSCFDRDTIVLCHHFGKFLFSEQWPLQIRKAVASGCLNHASLCRVSQLVSFYQFHPPYVTLLHI